MLLLLAQSQYDEMREYIGRAQLAFQTSGGMDAKWTNQQLELLREQRIKLDEEFYGKLTVF